MSDVETDVKTAVPIDFAKAELARLMQRTTAKPSTPATKGDLIQLRVTPEQKAEWQAAADADKRALSDWIRLAAEAYASHRKTGVRWILRRCPSESLRELSAEDLAHGLKCSRVACGCGSRSLSQFWCRLARRGVQYV